MCTFLVPSCHATLAGLAGRRVDVTLKLKQNKGKSGLRGY